MNILPVRYSKLKPAQRRKIRNLYVKLQKDKCYWCDTSLNDEPPIEITNKVIDWALFPPNFLKHPIHLQHCHDTDLTEGAVHAYCNAVMWQYYQR